METKTVQLQIPEYLTIKQYQKIHSLKQTENKLENALNIISAVTDIDVDELRYWDMKSIQKVNSLIEDMITPGSEFHSLIEYNDTLYGYSNITQQTLGEYIDLETFAKDINLNLHKVASILYRPVIEHQFDTFDFQLKHHLKVVKNKDIANVFEYYDIEKYTIASRKKREKEFLNFPVSIALGAISFFLAVGSQYLTSTVYSDNPEKIKMTNKRILESLIQSTGVGGGLFTHSLKPIYLKLQATSQ